MELTRWSRDLDVNISSINEQHRRLIYLTNQICNAVTMNEPYEEVCERFSELIECTARHFADEEGLMARMRYKDIVSHRQLHRNILDVICALKEKCDLDPSAINSTNIMVLDYWTNHISDHDMAFARHMAAIHQWCGI